MTRLLAKLLDFFLCKLTIFVTGIRPDKSFQQTNIEPQVYYANHNSHGDFLLLWVSFPYIIRKQMRPVAASDYWSNGVIRRFLATNVFNMLLIDRRSSHPQKIIEQMSQALQTHSLIIFPEGTRKTNEDIPLQPFKSGIYGLAKANPHIKFVPIWIHNIKNVLPKGFVVPIPLLCDIRVGNPIYYQNENKGDFLANAQNALLALQKESQ